MQALTASEIIDVWEYGKGRRPVTIALILLAAAIPEKTWPELTALEIGERDRLLLELREKIFGPHLHGFVECPDCEESLEINLASTEIHAVWESDDVQESLRLNSQGLTLQFRMPTSEDLLRIEKIVDISEARHALALGCILQAKRKGKPVEISKLSESIIHDLSEKMVKCDPRAELLLNLTCPSCAHKWVTLFDVATFLWNEISAQAKRLFAEIHILARAYGWNESDILAMSAWRRQCYLERAGL